METIKTDIKKLLEVADSYDRVRKLAQFHFDAKFNFPRDAWFLGFQIINENSLEIKYGYGQGDVEYNSSFTIKNMIEVDLKTLKTKLITEDLPVTFTYFKKDGTVRNAVGTLHESLIPEELRPKDPSTNSDGNLKYFDLEKNAWRSLSKDASLVTIFE